MMHSSLGPGANMPNLRPVLGMVVLHVRILVDAWIGGAADESEGQLGLDRGDLVGTVVVRPLAEGGQDHFG